MRPTLLLAILAILVAACGAQTTEPRLGDNVDVPLNTGVRIPGDTTTVRFTDVTADSRCPTGAQCVWAGEATVLLTVGGTQQVTLRQSPGSTGAPVIVGMYQVMLVDLKPYPKLGSPIAKGDYVATLKFGSARD